MPETVASPAAPASPNVGASPNVSTGADSGASGADTGAQGAGSGSAPATKSSKFNFDLGDGGPPTEVDLGEGETVTEEGGGAAEFKFADLDSIKDSNPDLYKSLKAELSKATRYSKFGLKSPEDYKSQSERINRLSDGKGLDGIEETMSGLARELQGFRSGDVGTWAKEAPEEFGMAAGKIVDEWGKTDPRGYVGHVAKAAMYALTQKDNYGQSAIDAFNAAYATADDKTKHLLDRVAHTLDAINQNSQYVPDQTAVRDRQLSQREAAVWNQKVDVETTPLIRQACTKALNAAITQYGLELDADDRQAYLADMESKWYEAAKKNPRLLKDLDAAGKTKNITEIMSLVKANRQGLAVEALKDVYRTKLSKLKGNIRKEASSKTEASSGGSQSSGATPWTGKRDPRSGSPVADMDFSRMNADGIDAMSGTFYIKGRKELFSL